ncbi:hypothetical protein Tco_0674418 [Tanacetum coccineum]
MKATKRSKRQKTNSDLKEEKQLKAFLKIVPDEEEEVDYEVLDKRYPIVDWESKFYHTNRYGKPHNYYKVIRSNGSSRWIKTFSEMVTRLDRMILRSYDDLWKNQEKWILKKWNFYENCGVHILMLEDSTEFYMMVERRYPLTTETLERMLALRKVAESESEAIFDLLRFIQKQINESRSHDEGEEDFVAIWSQTWQLKLLERHQELASPEANGFCKELASPKQTALGKDILNPLIVDSLLKTMWLSMHLVIAMKHWLFQSKRLLEWVQGVEEERMGIGSREGPTAPAPLAQTNPFRAFIKENIEASRTLIEEHDQHDKIGEAPKHLACDDGIWEKEFLGNFSMEIPERRFRSSYGSLPLKGARRSSSSRSLEIGKNRSKTQSMFKY